MIALEVNKGTQVIVHHTASTEAYDCIWVLLQYKGQCLNYLMRPLQRRTAITYEN